MTDAKAALRNELGASLPLVEDLDDSDATDLLELFQSAMREETAALHRAVDETINGLPRLFRGTARKIVFPGGR
ncbi:MAG: hypothetical protein LLG14_19815 [Nocardiaceae bacterium]|nr:hypothetical protein [Nocardiaceae bacterium]